MTLVKLKRPCAQWMLPCMLMTRGLRSWSVYKSPGVVFVMLACVIVEGVSQTALQSVIVLQTSLSGISVQPCMMFRSQGLLR